MPEAPVGWVYRADEVTEEVAPALPQPVELQPLIEIYAPEIYTPETYTPEEQAASHPLLVAGMGLFFIGVGSVGVVTLVAFELIATPIRIARGWF